jgi:hypothetical protein
MAYETIQTQTLTRSTSYLISMEHSAGRMAVRRSRTLIAT